MLRAFRLAQPIRRNNSAVNALLAGRIEEAEAHLREVERSRAPMFKLTTGLMRAKLCVRRSELEQALAHLDTVLAAPLPWFGRDQARQTTHAARGLRAVVRALLGDVTGARSDLEALGRIAMKGPDAEASASLAEALLLRRAGDAKGLAASLDRNWQLLMESTSPRERALVRALRWSSRQRDVAYRTPTREQANNPEGSLEAWLEAVFPGAGDLAEDTIPEGPPGTPASPRERARVRSPGTDVSALPAVSPPARPSWPLGSGFPRLLVLWVVLIVAFLAIWQFMGTPDRAEPVASAPAGEFGWLVPTAVLFYAVLLGGVIWRMKRAQRAFLKAAALIPRDARAAHDELVRWTRSGLKQLAAQAHLMLAGLAERAADYQVALAHADAGLRSLRRYAAKAAAYDAVLPGLRAMRALAFAGLDQRSKAEAELMAIERGFPSFFFLERSRVRVQLLLAVRAGDYQAAARIAADRSPDLPISYRDDVLGEIAQAVAPGQPVARTRLNRLRHEIEVDPVLARWLDVTAPGLMDRFDALRAA